MCATLLVSVMMAVQAAPGVDREDIEVAAQCLSEVFKINQQHDGDDDNSPLPSLPDLITAAAHTSSLGLVQSEDSDRVMADAAAAEEPIGAESPMTATTPTAAPNSSSMFALNNQSASTTLVNLNKPPNSQLWKKNADKILKPKYQTVQR